MCLFKSYVLTLFCELMRYLGIHVFLGMYMMNVLTYLFLPQDVFAGLLKCTKIVISGNAMI